jgi:VanZ family protein
MIRKNLFSILAFLLLLFLSLTNTEKFQMVSMLAIPTMDKLVHFGMYFFLMSVILIEHRRSIRTMKHLLIAALVPFAYGVLMEVLQYMFTSTRSGDFLDALADGLGVLCAVLLWIIIKPLFREPVR